MSGLASALERSARIVCAHLDDPCTARRLIGEVRREALAGLRGDPVNVYLLNMACGYAAALAALYEIAERPALTHESSD